MSTTETIADVPYGTSTWGYLLNNAPAQGTISYSGDIDTYKIYMQSGVQYHFYLNENSYPSGIPNYSAYFGLYSPSGSYIGVSSTVSTSGGYVESMLYTPSTSGFYYVNVAGLSGGTGSYYLDAGPSMYSGVTDDHSAYWSSAASLSYNTITTGDLEIAGDVDGFKVSLTAGDRYYYELLTTVPDLFLAIKDLNYNTLDFGVSGQVDSGSFTADATGTVMLYLSSNSFVNVGSYYIFLSPTYSNTANLVTGGAGNDVLSGTSAQDELHGSWGADSVSGYGGNDFLFGGPGTFNDTLDGGIGADLLIGGAGNDIYVVDNAGDTVNEYSAEGTDLVQSSITYTLTDNVENLTLTGTGAINGTGNTLNNTLTGNSAANILNGEVGNDTLLGGGGNDTYIVGQAGDVVTELTGEGIDLVKSGITYALKANVEKLTLTGTAAINGTGNVLNNTLVGNSAANKLVSGAGNDILNGGAGNDTLLGGTGKDILTGGLGNDFFVFNTALNASTNIDTLKDYTAANDTIQLENAIFTSLTATGALNTANFVVGTAAADASDYLVYNSSTGALYYDADANGAGSAVQFATVYSTGTTPATLSAAEFVVI